MGEIIALITACCWAGSSIFFTSASKKIAPLLVNRLRLVLAAALLMLAHLAVFGTPIPLAVERERWLWLGLSGIIGLALGDTFLFQCYALLGNRLGTLIMAAVPVISSVEAWLLLGEKLGAAEMAGIALCVGGIVIVVLERGNGSGTARTRAQYVGGILAGVLSALCQATGLALAKRGLGGGFSALSGVTMRMLTAMLALWIAALLTGAARSTLRTGFANPAALRVIAAGTLVGPVVGVWLSLLAIQLSNVGVASTLMALTPVLLLPVARWGYHERVSLRAVAGTVVALLGVALIFIL
ncbi:MAG: DMT family transporter [Anaerolineae bacterium]|nr:DMT family transporter [Anaerolineae bacterium]